MSRNSFLVLLALAAGCRAAPQPSLSPAQSAFDAGEYDRCVQLCAATIDAGQTPADAHLLRGKAYERLGEHARAAADFEKVRREDPSRAEAAFRQARCHLAMGQTEQAEATIQGCLSRVYDSLSMRDQMLAHAVAGEVHFALGDFDHAASDYEAALKIARGSRPLGTDRSVAVIHYNLSWTHFQRNSFRRAREAYQDYLDASKRAGLEPEGEDLYTLAVLHFLCGDVRQARNMAATLPPDLRPRLEGVLSGEVFSVRTLYDQTRKEKESTDELHR
ncbi:MAG: tetratricopeptide repeat protein [Planctomycetes bacterium]|nr:tetratricopeptide repeat protein [Planctomycetota bacterium]